uniref:Proteasome activator pa28 beta subunit-containing protein n=1 Tax=Trepomonas sp. PC1 TaxID=1076344 RepID=A0A146KF25_9EUKA|eukprot:JAP95313.1 Proteasome activator pa28 beta subunit-containing protein [Trepomonas sp. PC1]
MRSQTTTAQDDARIAIFKQLPQLYLDLNEELAKNNLLNPQQIKQNYNRTEALLIYKNQQEAAQLTVNSSLIQKIFNGKDQENIQIAAQINPHVQELHNLVEKYAERFKQIADPVLLWFQVLLPKDTTKATANQEFLIQLLQDMQKAYEDAQGYYEKFTVYHNQRSNCVKQITKHGIWDFYAALMLIDMKELQTCRDFIIDLSLNCVGIYNGIVANQEKLKQQKDGMAASGVIY